MQNKRVLIVLGMPLEYSASVTFQNRQLIRGLSKCGFTVDVLQPRPNHLSNFYDESLKGIYRYVNNVYLFELSLLYNFFVRMTKPTSVDDSKKSHEDKRQFKFLRGLRKLVLKIFFAIDVDGSLQFSRRMDFNFDPKTYDYIVSSSDPVFAHVLAGRLLRNTLANDEKRPVWIQYWGDPLFTALRDSSNWYKKTTAFFREKKLLERADLIVYASPFTLGEQRRTFPEWSKKMTFANQCAEFYEELHSKNPENEKGRRLRIGYFGDYMSFNRNIIPFYEAARYLPDVEFFIVGGSDLKLEGRENVVIINRRLPHGEISVLERSCDILYAVANKTGSAIPAKIYYWAGFRKKPIIVAVDGPYKAYLKSYLERFDRYVLVENNLHEVRNAINRAIEMVKLGNEHDIPDELREENMVGKMLKCVTG